jgi:hypothetical protein
MDLLNNGLGLFATILGVVGLAGGAAGYFKASRGDSIIKYQAIEIDGLRRKVGDQEKDLVTKEAAVKTLEAAGASKDEAIAELKRNIAYLQKLGQGSPQLKKLTTAIENQTKIFTAYMKKENK